MAIRFGVEISFDRRFEDDIRDHLRAHRYDYVIGSVHVYRRSPYAAEAAVAATRKVTRAVTRTASALRVGSVRVMGSAHRSRGREGSHPSDG